MNMRLTIRDFRLLHWIHTMGFVTIDQIARYLQIDPTTAHKRMKKMVTHKYLYQERITVAHAIYYLSRQGVDICSSVLPVLRRISLSTYHHDLSVVSLSLQLIEKLGGVFTSERELRHRQGRAAFSRHRYRHFSDGDFLWQGKHVAIEAELSKKSEYRRDKIFRHYLEQSDYEEVWYFYRGREVKNQLQPYTEKVTWLKLYDLDAFLKSGELVHVERG